MPWRQFVLFNFLGAVLWVTTISCVGYLFGQHWGQLLRMMRNVNLGLLIGLALGVVLLLWRRRRAEIARLTAADEDNEEAARRPR